ncbi:MAG: hypothetical protein HYX49_07050 [Chloroflexi bacterium]|nr:hypothetical protein [Chloroflexota bacterium]
MLNFTLQDLFGTTLAILLAPIVFVIPGYVTGWALDLFEFRNRSRLTRYLIGMVLSNAVVPIFAYLIYRYTSSAIILLTLLAAAIIFLIVDILPLFRNKIQRGPEFDQYQRMALFIGAGWVVFSTLLLVDLQIGDRLYFPTVSYDYLTRIALINAITRTGMPPINPSFFPGYPVQLTFLYFYWYVFGSIIDQIGGSLVNAQHAMLASVTWTGLSLMAVIAIYLRIRNKNTSYNNPWRAAIIGNLLLLISGMDFIPVIAVAIKAREALGNMVFNGRIEGWNMPVMSWLNAITWVPNHVSAALQSITAMLLLLSVFRGSRKQKLTAGIVAGVALASSFGTSVWITLVFAVFWAAWTIYRIATKENLDTLWSMIIAGVTGAGLSIPFVSGLLSSGGASSSSGLPLALYVRPFFMSAFFGNIPQWAHTTLNFFFLPLNYLMELGFFLVIGLYWIQHRKKEGQSNNPFQNAEIILLLIISTIMSFVYSTIIQINDLGIRAWLPAQFILLVWTTDVIQDWLGNKLPGISTIFHAIGQQVSIGKALQFLLIIGFLTTALEAFSTRMWPMLVDWNIAGFPNDLSPDTNLGRRSYDARLAYEFINNNIPASAITQNNPNSVLDRASGLYGTNQMAISDRTAYGIPADTFKLYKSAVAEIFERESAWIKIDQSCKQYYIDILIVNDLDPLWKKLPALEQERSPLYQNKYYAVFACGNFNKIAAQP